MSYSDQSPKDDAELATDLLRFIEEVEKRRDGNALPLTHEEQACFLQYVFKRAQTIYHSEPFLRAKLTKTLGDYVEHIKITTAKPKKRS